MKKNVIVIIDGYNVIHGVPRLQEIMDEELEQARDHLFHWMQQYAIYRKRRVIIVYDAYKTMGIKAVSTIEGQVEVVFTRKGQTADSYIEGLATDLTAQYHNEVRVVTKDLASLQIVYGQGAIRMTPMELYYEVEAMEKRIKRKYARKDHPQGEPIKAGVWEILQKLKE